MCTARALRACSELPDRCVIEELCGSNSTERSGGNVCVEPLAVCALQSAFWGRMRPQSPD